MQIGGKDIKNLIGNMVFKKTLYKKHPSIYLFTLQWVKQISLGTNQVMTYET
jgi:hypothetical protein